MSKVGQPNLYSKNSAIGAWVLETQMYAHEPPTYQQRSPPHHRSEPQLPAQYGHHHPMPFFHQQQLEDQHHLDLMSLERQEYGHNGVYEMALAAPMGQVHHVPETEEPFGSFSSKSLEPLYMDPGRMRQNKGKRPPPPPRRSRDTQLSHLAV